MPSGRERGRAAHAVEREPRVGLAGADDEGGAGGAAALGEEGLDRVELGLGLVVALAGGAVRVDAVDTGGGDGVEGVGEARDVDRVVGVDRQEQRRPVAAEPAPAGVAAGELGDGRLIHRRRPCTDAELGTGGCPWARIWDGSPRCARSCCRRPTARRRATSRLRSTCPPGCGPPGCRGHHRRRPRRTGGGLSRRLRAEGLRGDRRALGTAGLGRDLADLPAIVRDLEMASGYWSAEGAARHVLSAIEIALQDARAQALGLPLWRALGGIEARALPVYASGGDARDPRYGGRDRRGRGGRRAALQDPRPTAQAAKAIWCARAAAAARDRHRGRHDPEPRQPSVTPEAIAAFLDAHRDAGVALPALSRGDPGTGGYRPPPGVAARRSACRLRAGRS